MSSRGILSTLKCFLDEEVALGAHSSVYLLMPANGTPTSKARHLQFVWVQSAIRPGGYSCPIQCPRCGRFDTVNVKRPDVQKDKRTRKFDPKLDQFTVELFCNRCPFVRSLPVSPALKTVEGDSLLSLQLVKQADKSWGRDGRWCYEDFDEKKEMLAEMEREKATSMRL